MHKQISLFLATAFISCASYANAMVFNITKNSVADYGEESIQMQTSQGSLAIYAINLTDDQGITLVNAQAGQCLSITSPSDITKYDDYYSIDQIDDVAIVPCENTAAVDTGCLLENDRILIINDLYNQPVYKYGKAAKAELVLPTGSANSNVYKGIQTFAAGAATYLRFTNGNYSYVAYNGIGRGWEFVGLMVYQGENLINYKTCKNYDDLLTGIDYEQIAAPADTDGDFIMPPV